MKYTQPEIERRWLVRRNELGPLEGALSREIEDVYITGTRLRLRRLLGPDGSAVYKFGKKYGRTGGLAEPTTNLYLDEMEYQVLASLGGVTVRKLRYSIAGGALDIYVTPCAGLVIFEVEFASETEAHAYRPPAFTGEEITENSYYSGAAIAGLSPDVYA